MCPPEIFFSMNLASVDCYYVPVRLTLIFRYFFSKNPFFFNFCHKKDFEIFFCALYDGKKIFNSQCAPVDGPLLQAVIYS